MLGIFLLLATSFAAEISPVFTEFISLEWEKAGKYHNAMPQNPYWIAKVGWTIKSTMQPGDTFKLNLPCVYKFSPTVTELLLSDGSTNYAKCKFFPGDVLLGYSDLNCEILVVPPTAEVSGQASFPLTFNVGLSNEETDLKCAKLFHEGNNQVTFKDGNTEITATANFETDSNVDANKIAYSLKNIPSLNKHQAYLLAGNCPNGYKSGTIGFELSESTEKIDCSKSNAYISNMFNDWHFPKSAEPLIASVDCQTDYIQVTYGEIPAGYRPFIAGIVVDPQPNVIYFNYVNSYTCKGDEEETDNGVVVGWIIPQDAGSGQYAQRVEVVTQTYLGSTTSIGTLPYETEAGRTMTVVVNVPIPTVTTTSTYIGVSTSYSTVTVDPGETATVIVVEPIHTTTTISTCWSYDATTTITVVAYDNPTDTVAVFTPCEVESTDPPVETTDPPVESTDPPVESTDPPVESTDPPVESTDPPVESTDPPVESTNPTVESTDPSIEPIVETTEPTVESTDPSVEPTEPSVEPTVELSESTEPTVDPTDPAEPTPSIEPTEPTAEPTIEPSIEPTGEPTEPPKTTDESTSTTTSTIYSTTTITSCDEESLTCVETTLIIICSEETATEGESTMITPDSTPDTTITKVITIDSTIPSSDSTTTVTSEITLAIPETTSLVYSCLQGTCTTVFAPHPTPELTVTDILIGSGSYFTTNMMVTLIFILFSILL
ncbi:Agglutinin-like protein 1 [Spathaspora sp. JA1]|nr:Agglutinin-like protein 1 [Spathaspora sp. JA1]